MKEEQEDTAGTRFQHLTQLKKKQNSLGEVTRASKQNLRPVRKLLDLDCFYV